MIFWVQSNQIPYKQARYYSRLEGDHRASYYSGFNVFENHPRILLAMQFLVPIPRKSDLVILEGA